MRKFVAAGFGSGFIPRKLWGGDNGAGTFGAAAQGYVNAVLGAKDHADPNWIVIDEVAGTLIALVGLTGAGWFVALVVARLGDIFKVLPGVPQAERLPGAVGITADDVVAGLYGLAAGWLVMLL